MFCHVCGKKMDDTAVFCHSCGTKRKEENVVEQAQAKNHKKIGIITTLVVLIPIIGLVVLFVMRTGSEGDSALVDALHNDYVILADNIEDNPFTPIISTEGWSWNFVVRFPADWDSTGVRISHITGEIIPSDQATRYDREVHVMEGPGHDRTIVLNAELILAYRMDGLREGHISSREIHFTDHHSLMMYEFADSTLWMTHESSWGTANILLIYHGGPDRSVFDYNEDLLMTIAASMIGSSTSRVVETRLAELDRQRFAAELTAERLANQGVTLDNFESLRPGMFHSTVSEILGPTGVLYSSTRIPDHVNPLLHSTWRTYVWDGPTPGTGISVTFRNSLVYNMSQTGLR